MNPIRSLAVVAILAGSCLAAQAALFARPGGMVYDSDQDITWLADWNYAKTSGADADGLMNWYTATDWAKNLVYGGFSDWRLPTIATTASSHCSSINGAGVYYGYNCTGSEMGHMFYIDLGATADNSILSGSNTANLALFSHMQSNVYWSGTVWPTHPVQGAMCFRTDMGFQGACGKDDGFPRYAVAVRRGDVSAVPEPQAAALMLAGLGVIGLFARRRKH